MEVLEEGQQIKHGIFGLGVVTEADEVHTTVHFEDHGRKKFVTSLMQAEVVGTISTRIPRSGRRRKALKDSPPDPQADAAPGKKAARRR